MDPDIAKMIMDEVNSLASTVQERIAPSAMHINGQMLEYASDEMKNNEGVVLAAVEENGIMLSFASEETKRKEDIVAAAVAQDWRALE